MTAASDADVLARPEQRARVVTEASDAGYIEITHQDRFPLTTAITPGGPPAGPPGGQRLRARPGPTSGAAVGVA